MRIWTNIFAAFKISAAHDERKNLSRSLKSKVARSPELCRFQSVTDAMERRLMSAAPGPTCPSELHANIMRGVRTARRERELSTSRVALGWVIPAAAAVIIVVL